MNPFLIQLFKDTVAHKIDSIDEGDLKALLRLMEASKLAGQGEMIGVFNQSKELVAGGFFLKDKSRITYLKAPQPTKQKIGCNVFIVRFAFKQYVGIYHYFDFGDQMSKMSLHFTKNLAPKIEYITTINWI